MARTPYSDRLRYTIEAVDDLGRRVVVVKDRQGRVIWRKTRELVGDEIVESLVQDASDLPLWTIHRPTRGWYLILRSPSYPSPKTYISLRPSPLPSHTDRFTFTLSPSHRPPPTPTISFTAAVDEDGVRKRSLSASASGSGGVGAEGMKRRSLVGAASPRFPPVGFGEAEEEVVGLSPGLGGGEGGVAEGGEEYVVQGSSSVGQGLVARLTGLFTDPVFSASCTSLPRSPSTASTSTSSSVPPTIPPPTPEEIFRYTDLTSMFSLCGGGELELAEQAVEKSGMGVGFWIAVGLAWVGYREDKEAYGAATEDIQ